ncbi:MAG: guanylate kinase [Oscillospiraceae bacterium]|nr:guanylate kinase [Oscillospiraceae bacterium]
MKKKGFLIVLSGPSGVGKGAISKQLRERDNNLWYSVSATTRKPRQGEVNGVDYYFLSEDEFLKKVHNGDFIEWACFCNNYYGTPKTKVLEMLERNVDVILEIDIQGAKKVKENFKEAIFIFILPPSREEWRHRILKRGTENDKERELRLETGEIELKELKNYDYAIINDLLINAVRQVEIIVEVEKLRVFRYLEDDENEWKFND